MQIVQTYWSLPTKNNDKHENNGRGSGGWLSERTHAMSWALSCLKCRQFYPNIDLYTDKAGREWIIDELQLPYSNVYEELDSLNHYDSHLWALPKIYTYSKQNKPFLHIDSDAYIWEPFRGDLTNSGLFVQNLEINYPYYKAPLFHMAEHFEYIPDIFKDVLSDIKNRPIISVNAGIIGGNDTEFFKIYGSQVFDLIDRNRNKLDHLSTGNLNIIFEQLYFHLLATSQNKHIEVLLENIDDSSVDLVKFAITPLINKYVHTIGYAKQNPVSCNQVELRLRYEFPKMYDHIKSLYKSDKSTSWHEISPPVELRDSTDPAIAEIFPATCRLLQQNHIEEWPDTWDSFGNYVEELYFANQHDLGHILMSDVFQLEKNNYRHNLSPKKIGDYLRNKELNSIRHLYGDSVEDVMDLPCSLDEKLCSISYLSFTHPEIFTAEYVNEVINQGNNSTIGKELQITITVSGTDGKPVTTKLTSWSVLLVNFDGELLTGNQLLGMLKSKSLDFSYDGNSLERDILYFMTTNIYYSSYLKIVEPQKYYH
jgi:hypothetical protein